MRNLLWTICFLAISSMLSATPILPAPPSFKNVPQKISYLDTLQPKFKYLKETIDSINIGAQKPTFNGTVLVSYQDKILYLKNYGVADKDLRLPHAEDIPTQVASITKTFTGMAVLWLQEKGFLNIEDPFQKYFWDFPYEDITIEMMLSHQSGLQDYLKFAGRYWKDPSDPMYNQEILNIFTQQKLGLRFTPGTDFDYCNSNFALLGLLIEKVTGLPYKKFMNEYVFEPLNMENSFVYDPKDTYERPYAKSYNARFTDWKNNYKDGVYGDKGIFTTATDLLKWDWALDNEAFVPKETQDDAFTPRLPWNKHKNYGLGWRIKTYPNGEKYVYHTGWWHGYQGIFSRYIKDDLTIIILSNRFIKGISDNAEEIYNICQKELNLTPLG